MLLSSLLSDIQTGWKPTCSKLVLRPAAASAGHGIFGGPHVLVSREPARDFRTLLRDVTLRHPPTEVWRVAKPGAVSGSRSIGMPKLQLRSRMRFACMPN